MRFSDASILVAGGAGFIGSHIVDRLIRLDSDVTVLDNLYSGRIDNIKQEEKSRNFHFVKGDVRNYSLVKKVVNDADFVFNLAAIVSVKRSIEKPQLTNDVNVKGTLNLLKASLDSGVKRFIQASSASVYGDTQTLPLKEDMAPKPISPYAISELAAENYARVFYRVYGLETVCLRYFNVYGPRQAFNQYSGVITIFISQLLEDRPPVIFGDGKQTRDFVYVEDVVSANMLAVEKKGIAGEIFNIASGKPLTLNRLFEILQEIMNKESLKPIYTKARQGDIKHSCADIQKARKILGYDASYSMTRGLKRLVKSYALAHAD